MLQLYMKTAGDANCMDLKGNIICSSGPCSKAILAQLRILVPNLCVVILYSHIL